MYKQNSLLNLNKNSGFFQTQSSIRVFGAKNRGDFDTILVSGPTFESVQDGKIKTSVEVFDGITEKRSILPVSEASDQKLLRSRSYLKIGSTTNTDTTTNTFRSVLQFNPQSQIAAVVGENQYYVQSATLFLTPKAGTSVSGEIQTRLAIDKTVSETANWDSPTPETGTAWAYGPGGGVNFPTLRSTHIDNYGGANYPWYVPGWSFNDPLVFPDREEGIPNCIYLRPGTRPGDIQNPFIDIPYIFEFEIVPVSEPPLGVSSGGEFTPLQPVYIQPDPNDPNGEPLQEIYYWQGRYWKRNPNPRPRGSWEIAYPTGWDQGYPPSYDEDGTLLYPGRRPIFRHKWVEYDPCWGIKLCRYSQTYSTPDGIQEWEGFGLPPWTRMPPGEAFPTENDPENTDPAVWEPYKPGGGNPGVPVPNNSDPQRPYITTPIGYDREQFLTDDRYYTTDPTGNPDSGTQWVYNRMPCNSDPLRPDFQGPGFSGSNPFPPPLIPPILTPFFEEIIPFFRELFPYVYNEEYNSSVADRVLAYPSTRTTQSNQLNSANKVQIDITNLVSEWFSDTSRPLSLVLWSPSGELQPTLMEFQSLESTESLVGSGVYTTCKFLSAGDTTSFHSRGVVVTLEAQDGGTVLITKIINDPLSDKNFKSFQTLVPIGATFTLIDPDVNNSLNLGSSVCTVLDRPTEDSVVVSGLSMPSGVNLHKTTVEFVATVELPNTTNIIDILSPSPKTVEAFSALNPEDVISVNYSFGTTQNNAKEFTVSLVSDETIYDNRIRVYVKEAVVSENRTGQPTEFRNAKVKPYLQIDLVSR